MENERWLLPEGIEELLPPQALGLELLRRRVLDLLLSWGYELVTPPLIEYLDSLLTGTGNDLDLQTFKLTDQLSGRLMGVRADMTPQVARIDAHHLRREVPTRLCYLGTVLKTRPDDHGGTRAPLQLGAELYGHPGPESDIEVLALMVAALREAGLEALHVDLGHVGIFRGLARRAGLGQTRERALFDALQRKASAEIEQLLAGTDTDPTLREMLTRLAELHGDESVLDEAERLFADADAEVREALANLREVAAGVRRRLPGLPLHFDLAELRGYHYHTGAVFAAYTPGSGRAVAVGGRYDNIGAVFGRPRAATGFSTDLKAIVERVAANFSPVRGIFAPCVDDPALESKVAALRAEGERVVPALARQSGGAVEMGCDRELVRRDEGWQVIPISGG